MLELPTLPTGAPRDQQSAQGSFTANFVVGVGLKAHKYVVMVSSQSDQKSYERRALQHGVFTYFLLKGFGQKSADTNHNKWISAEEAYGYAGWRAIQYEPTQRPDAWDYNRAQDLDMIDFSLLS